VEEESFQAKIIKGVHAIPSLIDEGPMKKFRNAQLYLGAFMDYLERWRFPQKGQYMYKKCAGAIKKKHFLTGILYFKFASLPTWPIDITSKRAWQIMATLRWFNLIGEPWVIYRRLILHKRGPMGIVMVRKNFVV